MTDIAVHGLVTGRVQGVFYRASLAEEAQRLNLTGYVKNLADGRVEYVVTGDEKVVDELVAWSRRGPLLAKITDLAISEYKGGEGFANFQIRY